MRECFLFLCVGATLLTTLGAAPGTVRQAIAQTEQPPATLAASTLGISATADTTCPNLPNAHNYDVIVFGDEVPGVMTALQVQRELSAKGHSSRVAIITEGNIRDGLGGHLVRGGLAYLDRNQVPPALRSRYGVFGQPSRLYQEFLRLGQVGIIALDSAIVSRGFSTALQNSGIEVIDKVSLGTVQTAGSKICAFTASGKTYSAEQFIDSSQAGELAAASGVEMMKGLEALGFPDSALSLGLMIDLYDVTVDQFAQMEKELIYRYFNPQDQAAQRWLNKAAGGDPVKRQELLKSMVDFNGQPKLLHQGTADSADVRSLAFSILVHGYLEQEYDLKSSGFLFDRANIAVLNDRLSFNALLFYADSETAQQLSFSGAAPTAEMRATADKIKVLFEKIGVPRVEIMDELYIRNAGQIANSVDELSATLMAAGGLPENEAIGTFGYHLDDRGGIEGLDDKVDTTVLRLFNFEHMPVFNYGFRHTLPLEKENLSVLGPASGFGGLGTTAGRIVEFNVSVGEGLAIAIADAMTDGRSLHSITNQEIRRELSQKNGGQTPATYGYRTDSFRAIATLERRFRGIDYEQNYLAQAQAFIEQGNPIEANRKLSRVLVLNPRSAEAYRLRGLIEAEAGNRPQAQRDLEQAITLYQAQGNIDSADSVRIALANLLD